MKKFMKLIGIVTVICLLITGISGCSNEPAEQNAETSDTLKIFVRLKNRPDCELVNQELSKITREKLGFDVEFNFGYNSDKIALMLASNEQMDIGLENYTTIIDRARQNAFVDITDKVKNEYPKLYNAIPEELWEGVKIDGKIYAVPTYKEFAESWVVLVDKKVIEENNIDISKIKELKDVEPILAALKKDPERAGFEILSTSTTHLNLALKNKYDVITEEFVVKRDDPDKIVHFMETKEYRDFVYLMRDWYNKGYIAKDITTRTDYSSYHNAGKSGLAYIWHHPYAEISLGWTNNADYEVIPVAPIIKTNTSMMATPFCIYSKSKNVDKALAFLELWNTDPQVKNMITYGIEGKHYDLVDGKVKRREGALDLYKMDNAASGNMMISALLVDEPDDKYEKFKVFNESAIEASNLGFACDTTPVKSKLAACAGVLSEYNPLLCCGAVDPDQYLDAMLQGLKNAGVEDVKAELQKQYDAWRKNK